MSQRRAARASLLDRRGMAREVMSAIRPLTRLPLIAKLTPNVTRVAEIAEACEACGADAVSLVNTFIGMAVDTRTRKPILGTVLGGLSGPAIKPLALAKVWEVVQAVDIPVDRDGRDRPARRRDRVLAPRRARGRGRDRGLRGAGHFRWVRP